MALSQSDNWGLGVISVMRTSCFVFLLYYKLKLTCDTDIMFLDILSDRCNISILVCALLCMLVVDLAWNWACSPNAGHLWIVYGTSKYFHLRMCIRWESQETIHATYLKSIHGALSGNLCDPLIFYYSPPVCFSGCDFDVSVLVQLFYLMVLLAGLLCQKVYARYRDDTLSI